MMRMVRPRVRGLRTITRFLRVLGRRGWAHTLLIVTIYLTVVCLSLVSANTLQLRSQRVSNVTMVASEDGAAESLVFVSVSNNTVLELAQSDFASIMEVDLSDNRLVTVPTELFRVFPNVQRVVLSKNPIQELPPKLFSGLSELQEIIMEDTKLTGFPSTFIEECPKLRRVQITGALVHTIPSKAVRDLPLLENFNLSHNNVTTLFSDSFQGLPNLHTLDLSHNNLTVVPDGVFLLSNSWHTLDFERNNITTAPNGLKNAVVDGYVSFARNLWVEVNASEFANASQIRELRLNTMGIFTINSKAFSGMTSLKRLDLSDNVISMLANDAFDGLDNLEELLLHANQLREATFTRFPPQLKSLRLDSNRLDELPQSTLTNTAKHLQNLNLSQNWLWRVDSLSAFPNLTTLDLSWNRLEQLTSRTFDPVNASIRSVRLEYNEIASVSRSMLTSMIGRRLINITIDPNPGIGFSSQVEFRSVCPRGSVYEVVKVVNTTVYGCIQCATGSYHDNASNTCALCHDVSKRAYTAVEGATACSHCPMSANLHSSRDDCHSVHCSWYCWLTISIGLALPVAIMSGKYAFRRKKTLLTPMQEEHKDEDVDWLMGQLQMQVGLSPGSDDTSPKLYDLPREAQLSVLSTIRDRFFHRRAEGPHHLVASPRSTKWSDLEWSSFQMSRILSRNYHSEVFLGEYDGTQLVVKRLMILRFDMNELTGAISDVELLQSLEHPSIVAYYGTMWNEVEHFCVITEYVSQGDLCTLLEMEALGDNSVYLRILREVVAGLAYIHARGVRHHDLRSRNVLITSEYHAKLNDLRRNIDTKYKWRSLVVDKEQVPFIAPEVLTASSDDANSDIYSVGVLMAEMWCGRFTEFRNISPSTPTNAKEALVYESDEDDVVRFMGNVRAYFQRNLTTTVDDTLVGLMEDCLQRDPAQRPTAQTLLNQLDTLLVNPSVEISRGAHI